MWAVLYVCSKRVFMFAQYQFICKQNTKTQHNIHVTCSICGVNTGKEYPEYCRSEEWIDRHAEKWSFCVGRAKIVFRFFVVCRSHGGSNGIAICWCCYYSCLLSYVALFVKVSANSKPLKCTRAHTTHIQTHKCSFDVIELPVTCLLSLFRETFWRVSNSVATTQTGSTTNAKMHFYSEKTVEQSVCNENKRISAIYTHRRCIQRILPNEIASEETEQECVGLL